MAGGMHGKGVCMAGGVCGRGCAWQGGVHGGEACMAGGMYGGGHARSPPDRMTDRCKNITLPQLCCGR